MAVTAAIVAVGSELLDLEREDTNGPYLAACLREVGVATVARTQVADDAIAIAIAVRAAIDSAQLVLVTGGLGPTADDLTREAVAEALGRPLRRDPDVLETLRRRFAAARRPMAAVNERQADVIDGASVLANAHGTAPGLRIDLGERRVFLLPGPPREMKALADAFVLPAVRQLAGGVVMARRELRVAVTAESEVEQLAGPIYTRVNNPRTTILSGPGDVELHFIATGAAAEEAQARADAVARDVREALAPRVYSDDGRRLHEIVAALLVDGGHTLAVAESCTGGLLAGRLTAVPGASSFLDRAFVTYSNASKAEELAVDADVIARHGAVSEEVAGAMAEGARRAARVGIGVSITGIAGPDGGTLDKPVGLVYVGLSGLGVNVVRRCHLVGDRERVRFQATQVALEMLRRALLDLPPL